MNRLFSQNPLFILFRTLWMYGKGDRPSVVLYLSMAFAAVGSTLLQPLLLGYLINEVQNSQGSDLINTIWLTGAGLIGLQVLFSLFHYPSRLIEQRLAFLIRSRYELALFRKISAMPLTWHQQHHTGELVDRSQRAVQSLYNFCDRGFEISHGIASFVGSLVALCLFLPWAGLLVALISGVAAFTILLFDRALISRYREVNGQLHLAAATLNDYLANIGTVISLRLEQNAYGAVKRRIDDIWPAKWSAVMWNEMKWCTVSMVVTCTIAGVILLYALPQAYAGKALAAGSVFTLFEYLRRIGDCFFKFAYIYGGVVQQAADISATDIVWNARVDAGVEEVVSEPTSSQPWQSFTLTDVAYRYPDTVDGIGEIKELSLTVHRGERIALVGASGCGKTTFLRLLSGVMRPKRGIIALDQAPSNFATLSSLSTLIPQDPEIFTETILFNITMGLDASEAELDRVLRLSCFDQVLNRLPKGYTTNIAEDGVNLSGGEKQRLALARGLFFAFRSQSSLLLLDEPTSSIDPLNEATIYRNVMGDLPEVSIISSLHRLHLLPLFTTAYVFAQGRVIESGPVMELLTRGDSELGRRYRLAIQQSEDVSIKSILKVHYPQAMKAATQEDATFYQLS